MWNQLIYFRWILQIHFAIRNPSFHNTPFSAISSYSLWLITKPSELHMYSRQYFWQQHRDIWIKHEILFSWNIWNAAEVWFDCLHDAQKCSLVRLLTRFWVTVCVSHVSVLIRNLTVEFSLLFCPTNGGVWSLFTKFLLLDISTACASGANTLHHSVNIVWHKNIISNENDC